MIEKYLKIGRVSSRFWDFVPPHCVPFLNLGSVWRHNILWVLSRPQKDNNRAIQANLGKSIRIEYIICIAIIFKIPKALTKWQKSKGFAQIDTPQYAW